MVRRGVRISKEAKESGFILMREGANVLRIDKVEVTPKGNPHKVKIEAVNEHGEKYTPRFDLTKDIQEKIFWTFYNTGCGLDEDEDGFSDPYAMQGLFVDVDIKHDVKDPITIEEEDEDGNIIEKELPQRTFVNTGYVYGPVSDFGEVSEGRIEREGESVKPKKKAKPKQAPIEDDDEDEDDLFD